MDIFNLTRKKNHPVLFFSATLRWKKNHRISFFYCFTLKFQIYRHKLNLCKNDLFFFLLRKKEHTLFNILIGEILRISVQTRTCRFYFLRFYYSNERHLFKTFQQANIFFKYATWNGKDVERNKKTTTENVVDNAFLADGNMAQFWRFLSNKTISII